MIMNEFCCNNQYLNPVVEILKIPGTYYAPCIFENNWKLESSKGIKIRQDIILNAIARHGGVYSFMFFKNIFFRYSITGQTFGQQFKFKKLKKIFREYSNWNPPSEYNRYERKINGHATLADFHTAVFSYAPQHVLST